MSSLPTNYLSQALQMYDQLKGACSDNPEFHAPEPWLGKPIFHAFRTREGFNFQECPKCQHLINLRIVNVTIATDEGISSGFGPYASICEACEACVVVDQMLEESCSNRGVEYFLTMEVFSVAEDITDEEPDYTFKTYEGEDYDFLVEEGTPYEVMYRRVWKTILRNKNVQDKVLREKRRKNRKRERSARKQARR
ncbi:MAG: hypothetical protein EOP04_14775 [Proteobacteria bacterium]|nr:MAG: hypothetical protein EOP04_14775 [Pseudomonadota bacterium]